MIPSTSAPRSSATAEWPYNRFYILAISLVAALGGLMFGYDWVVIGGAELFYEKYFRLHDALQIGWAMSSALIGALAGGSLAGLLSDRLGRKPLLLFSGLLFVSTSIGTALATTFGTFIANRMAGGIAIGIASNISPLYIAEVAPAAMRGRLVAMNQLTIALGVVLAQLLNWLIARPAPVGEILSQSWNVQTGWRWMFAMTAVPALVFFLAMFFVPESPRWLLKKGRVAGARAVLERIGGPAYADFSVRDVEATLHTEDGSGRLRNLLEPKMRKILLLGVGLAVFQQWCGINVIYQYGSRIFADAGYAISGILFNIVITGLAGVVMTIIAMGIVDQMGRRFLMLSGAAGLTVIYTCTGLAYHLGLKGPVPVALVVAAIACYGYSLAPVTWVILSEIFPNRIRGAAMSVAVMALWLGNFFLAQSFPTMYQDLGLAKCFWVYAGICFLGFLFIWKLLPETKGKTLEAIEHEFLG